MMDPGEGDETKALVESGKANLDQRTHIQKNLKMQTPAVNINARKVKQINKEAHDKISYTYKERYCGLYEEKRRQGLLKRADSWEEFVGTERVTVKGA